MQPASHSIIVSGLHRGGNNAVSVGRHPLHIAASSSQSSCIVTIVDEFLTLDGWHVPFGALDLWSIVS